MTGPTYGGESDITPETAAEPETGVLRRPRPGSAAPVRAAGQRAVERRRPSPVPLALRAGPNLARVAAVSAWRLMNWSVDATTAGAGYVARRAMNGESAASILQEAAGDLRNVAWRALGLREEILGQSAVERAATPQGQTAQELQQRGTDLLRRSNDIHIVEDTHPAFSRILTEITPDEARILRYLYLEGPQPSIDVRTFRPFGIGSVLVAGGLNMIAEHAGCRNVERAHPYLTNLSRLGLIEFSKEQVGNPSRYQVIEAQPKVTEALKRAGRMPRTVHRSIHLNSFGEEFVRTCLPLNGRVVPQRNRVLQPGDGATP